MPRNPPYSTRFLMGNYTAASGVLYSVPDGKVAVVRNISAVSGASEAYIEFDVNGAPYWSHVFELPAGVALDCGTYEGRIVLNAGDELSVLCSGSVFVQASGYLLTDVSA